MPSKPISIVFADLLHTGHGCRTVPYSAAVVAAYAKQQLGPKVDLKIFKHPQSFSLWLQKGEPLHLACFSHFIWNGALAYAFAERIKARYPHCVTLFGGPNYPLDSAHQQQFWEAHPALDFHIIRDGEQPLVSLFHALEKHGFDIRRLKHHGELIENTHYAWEGQMLRGPETDPIMDLNRIPSPYLTGLLDPFLKEPLFPVIQTARGCPFACTYCQEGRDYFNRVRRYDFQRVKEELNYVAQRSVAPHFMLADTNFGMYRQDLPVAEEIARLKRDRGWPRMFHVTGKNKKERVLETTRLIQEANAGEETTVFLSAAVQSASPDVLRLIKRDNVSSDAMVGIAQAGKAMGANAFSELILALPGDSQEAHFQSVMELIDLDVNVMRAHQFIMLPGAEASTNESRQRFGLLTKYRVMPSTIHPYRLFDETFHAPEVDEICVGGLNMRFDDYLACRALDLTVEIFFNHSVFYELFAFMRRLEIPISSFIRQVHHRARNDQGPLQGVYTGFIKENRELFDSREQLAAFLDRSGTMERYQKGELGNNEQLMYRAVAIFQHMDEMHRIVGETVTELLRKRGADAPWQPEYLQELIAFSLLRKKRLLSVDKSWQARFHYDFPALLACRFEEDPSEHRLEDGLLLRFYHDSEQKILINQRKELYGTAPQGLGEILAGEAPVNDFYRKVVRHRAAGESSTQ
ncbi:MAG: radical SAM protein [Magnetococcales bacterium]|nr:radical SAM protein [Magnetococcales bacterium]